MPPRRVGDSRTPVHVEGICSRCERHGHCGRKLEFREKILIAALLVYGVGVIFPDTFRLIPFPDDKFRLLPLGTLGFEANNNGEIKHVDIEGPADKGGIQEEDKIDLYRTDLSARRAVNQYVFVRFGKEPVELQIQKKAKLPGDGTSIGADAEPLSTSNPKEEAKPLSPSMSKVLVPAPEQLPIEDWFGLLAAQIAAFAFIWLGWWLVWHRPSPQTWGLFLYSLWFNSGQYFFWYANLPDYGLVIFNVLQAFFEALGLTGLLVFAAYFPEPVATDSHQPGVLNPRKFNWLPFLIPFGLLWAIRTHTFDNYFQGSPTEDAYRVWFWLTWAIIITAGIVLGVRYYSQKDERRSILIVAVGGLVGLGCWLVAETHETIGVPVNLPVVDLWYACSVAFPFAVFDAVRELRAIDVRFPLIRVLLVPFAGIIFLVIFGIAHGHLDETLHHLLDEWWLPLCGLAYVLFSLAEKWIHHRIDRFLLGGWLLQKRELQSLAYQLAQRDDLQVEDINAKMLDRPIKVLGLKCGAIYKRISSHKFMLTHSSYPRVIHCRKCGDEVPASFEPQLPDAFFECVLRSYETSRRPRRCPIRNVLRRLGWSSRSNRSASSSTPVQAVAVYADCLCLLGSSGQTTPEYAIAIVRRHDHRHKVSRVIIFGPHLKDEALARDERRALKDVCAAAATAYLAAERRRNGSAAPLKHKKRPERRTKASVTARSSNSWRDNASKSSAVIS